MLGSLGTKAKASLEKRSRRKTCVSRTFVLGARGQSGGLEARDEELGEESHLAAAKRRR